MTKQKTKIDNLIEPALLKVATFTPTRLKAISASLNAA